MSLSPLLYLGLLAMSLATHSQASEQSKKLPLCPNSPNCVSSQSSNAGHFIAPFKFTGQAEAAWDALKKELAGQSRTVITEATGDTLHAEATSLIFRFVDDIDAILDADAKLIHVRSASRVGYSDLGVNRRRIEALRKQLQQAGILE
jgi:uncharacterized protein (DUF1499 family)